MRYKPRTDLERIIETVNTQTYGRIGKSILNKQLKQLELNIPQKTKIKDINDDIEIKFKIKKEKRKYIKRNKNGENIDDNNEGNNSDISNNQSSEDIDSKRKSITKRKLFNSQAKFMMSDLHLKTHFKAASVFSVLGSK